MLSISTNALSYLWKKNTGHKKNVMSLTIKIINASLLATFLICSKNIGPYIYCMY